MEPKIFLIWTCSIIFAATGIITLLGLVNMIKIDKSYLNKLFVSLILEIVAIGILAFRENFSPAKVETQAKAATNKAWIVTTKIQFYDKNGNLKPNQSKLVQDLKIEQISPSIIVVKNERRVQFWAIGTDKTGRDINLTFSDSRHIFSDFPYNLKSDSIIRINESENEILIPTINLYEPDTAYSPSINALKSTSNGPEIKIP
jgi:hypothetical protein